MSGWKVTNNNGGIQCSLVNNLEVYIEPIPRLKIELLMDKYTHQEWLGYLIGKEGKEGKVFVEDLSIPPHKEASGASAEAEPFHIPPKCVGFIHSHHSMGAFHSGTDDVHVDRNYPISITVAKQGNTVTYDCIGHRVTPCGKATVIQATIKFVQMKPPFNTDEFLKKAMKNISKGEKHYPAAGYVPSYVADVEEADLPYSWTPTGKKNGGKGALVRRIPSLNGDIYIDNHGNVLTMKEVEACLKGQMTP